MQSALSDEARYLVSASPADDAPDPSAMQSQAILKQESKYLLADTSAETGNPSTLVPDSSTVSADGETPQPAPPSPAVRDVTNSPETWWEDFLNHTSPFKVALDLSETYDDNIFIQPDKTSDYITNITPGISAEFGDKTAPNSSYFFGLAQFTELLYARNTGEDASDYFLDVHYQHQFTRLILGIEQQVRRETETDIDVGNRVQSEVYATVATATYAYNDDLSLRGTVTQNIVDYDSSSYFNTAERVVDFYALYQVLPKLSLGLGPRVGFVDIQDNPDQTYEDALVDLLYQVTDKTSITLVAGPEFREYEGSDGTSVTPVLDLTAHYSPTDDTTLKLEARRRRIVSYGTMDEDYTNNEVDASARQLVFQKVYVNFSAGYDLNDYTATASGAPDPDREDNYFFVRGGLEWQATPWLDVKASYQYARDDSNVAQYSFNDNQVTVGVNCQY